MYIVLKWIKIKRLVGKMEGRCDRMTYYDRQQENVPEILMKEHETRKVN